MVAEAVVAPVVRDGAEHILNGPDHVLFLLALLLPAVLKRESRSWKGTEAFRPAALNIVKLVTAFTIAHSVTLSLAVLGIVKAPARVVEPIIAASVIAAALNNVWPWFGERGWMVAFGFGLVHGFGFSFALTNTLQFAGDHVLTSLLAFNVGIELGQLLVLVLIVPALNVLFRYVDARIGGIVIAVIVGHTAWHWLGERFTTLSAFFGGLPWAD